jgi:ABC-2 type transport system ATP-binding protein
MIKVRDLTKRFGKLIAVNNVTFSISAGDIVGFLGPNGAGKSTSMRLLTGFLDADSGNIEICGQNIQTNRYLAKSYIGYLPEAAGGFPHLTVREFLTFCGESRGLAGLHLSKAIAKTCSLVDLSNALDKSMKSLSKGWRQRAWLAQAIIHDPPVLILDEPTDGLDPLQKENVRDLIRSVASDKAIILSTHILEEAEEICNRAIIINDGQVVADDTIKNMANKNGRIGETFSKLVRANPLIDKNLS